MLLIQVKQSTRGRMGKNCGKQTTCAVFARRQLIYQYLDLSILIIEIDSAAN